MRAAGCTLSLESPTPDLEVLLERGLGVTLDQFAPLERDVLGVTSFRLGRPTLVEINVDLTGSFDGVEATVTDRARWRSTLAHEASHVILHGCLFQLDDSQGEFFPDAETPEVQRCLKRAVRFGGEGRDPREVQANLGMAALLMPRKLFAGAARRAAQATGLPEGSLDPVASGSCHLVATLAGEFQVSRQATRIRLGQLGFFRPDAGTRLL